jgi:diaminopimelate epimerase
MSIPFTKFHGFGNEYIVIERGIGEEIDLGKLAVAMCDRTSGIGADGIVVIEQRDGSAADFFCDIVNPDGSLASFSGNGTRCAVAHLYRRGTWVEPRMRLETRSGVKTYDLIGRTGDDEFWFNAEIGKPRFASDEIPIIADVRREHVLNEPISVDGEHYKFSAVNVGNPVACLFVDSFDLDWRTVGRQLETHRRFPERANVVFVKVIDRGSIEIRIWERGAGETSASGTCATAAAVLSAFMLKTERKVNVLSPGGTTEVTWREDDEVLIKGRADFILSGAWP